MHGFRPVNSTYYLDRPRLLRLLPDSAGYVVWLEAPYGYGKSVLTSQWVEQLEGDGWRVLWLSAQGRDLKAALAGLINLPGEILWESLLDALWQQPTVVVLEDIEDGEELNPILKDVRGLLLLASRIPLPLPELLRLKTQGRLIHLQFKQLAFTLEEASELFIRADSKKKNIAKSAWEHSGGWPLPLHFASLTGETPTSEALLEGIHESLSKTAWEEALLLSTLPYLPLDAATEASRELASSGFAQELETGFRLHPLAAEAMRRAYLDDLQQVVKREQSRLPIILQAEALALAKLYADLDSLMETHYLLGRDDPHGMIRWDRLCAGRYLTVRGPGRLLGLAWAQSTLGHGNEAARSLDKVLTHPAATSDQKLNALGWRIFDLPPSEHALAESLMQHAEPLLEKGSRRAAGVFLSNAAAFYLKNKDWQRLKLIQRQALGYLEGTSAASTFSAVKQQQAEVQWELNGDLEAVIHATEHNLTVQKELNPYNVPVNHYDLGVYFALLSNPKALDHFEQAEAGAAHNLLYATSARAEKAALLRQPDALAPLVAQARAWLATHPDRFERVYSLWVRALRQTGLARAALEALQGIEEVDVEGLSIAVEHALTLAALGHTNEALMALPNPSACKRRQTRLELQAARYFLTRDENELNVLIELTMSGEQVLPALVPLETLPRHRPELSRFYPLPEVLSSGWREALALRHGDVPPLELNILGEFSVTVLGRELELTAKHKSMLTLMALGCDRNVIGEALWPETDDKKVLNNLHVQLNLLRKTLEPWGHKTYLSESGLVHTQADVWQLDTALNSGDASATLRLYKEPLAPGVELPLVDEARDEFRERVLRVFFDAAQEAEGDVYLERLLELDPLSEEALQQLLEKLIVYGRRREALRRYQAFARRLKEELGLDPLPETRKLLFDSLSDL